MTTEQTGNMTSGNRQLKTGNRQRATGNSNSAKRRTLLPAAYCLLPAFTVIELMVVIAIMVLLMGLLTPTVQKIYTNVMRGNSLATIGLLDGACSMYHNDFDAYPPSRDATIVDASNNLLSGRQLLPVFLTGYGPDGVPTGRPGTNLRTDDGRAGFGFRVEQAGRIFGPYNGVENIETTGSLPVFIDAFDNEIYYYCYDGSYVDAHNSPVPAGYLTNAASFRRDYILITAGPDGSFNYDTANSRIETTTDDVTNFLQEDQ